MELSVRSLSFLDWTGLDITIQSGEVVCLMGDSGSGKSLLLRAIADLVVNEGEVSLAGESRERITPTDWRRQVGYLPAEIFWWEESVGLHFLTPPSQKLLEQLRLPSDANDWPPSRLSMGERQRLGILRMLDRSPKVLLLDEPTANLDDKNATVVEGTILDYLSTQSASALWVTHSQEQAERVGSRTLEMKNKSLESLREETH